MADERSTAETHARDKHCEFYDWEYYRQLKPLIHGKVLDIGSGYLQFVKEYAQNEDVSHVTCLDKYTDEAQPVDKATRIEWVCPENIPNEIYDTIVSTEFIEHIERNQLEPLLQQIHERMERDSIFVGSTPNKISPTTNPYHLYEYTLGELTEIFNKYFTRVETWDDGQNCTLWKIQL